MKIQYASEDVKALLEQITRQKHMPADYFLFDPKESQYSIKSYLHAWAIAFRYRYNNPDAYAQKNDLEMYEIGGHRIYDSFNLDSTNDFMEWLDTWPGSHNFDIEYAQIFLKIEQDLPTDKCFLRLAYSSLEQNLRSIARITRGLLDNGVVFILSGAEKIQKILNDKTE